MATVRLVAEMPDAVLEDFLQLLRGWDGKRQDRRMAIRVEAPNMKADDMTAMFKRLAPEFDDTWSMPLPKNAGDN